MSDEITELNDISGVGPSKAESLEEAGYESVEDIKAASQGELSDVDGVGNALAARIKADVGGLEVSAETEAEVED
ncbi:MAG: RecA/RadA recombinase, partial [Haloquadratum sp. J07HQX50]